MDLSAPEGHSVNDGIPKELCSLGYMSVDDVVAQVLKLGKGSELAKVDVQQAYRNVPVHPGDRHLLDMEWQGRVFIDGALPFGLRSAPLLFTALGDGLRKRKECHGWVTTLMILSRWGGQIRGSVGETCGRSRRFVPEWACP